MTTPPETPRPEPSAPDTDQEVPPRESAEPESSEGGSWPQPDPHARFVAPGGTAGTRPDSAGPRETTEGVATSPSGPQTGHADAPAVEIERALQAPVGARLRRDRPAGAASAGTPDRDDRRPRGERAIETGAVEGVGAVDAGAGEVPGQRDPGTGGETGVVDPGAREGSSVLGDRTYDRILEPRSESRLPLGDGTWHQLARAYVRVQLITQGAVFVLVVAAAVAAQVITGVRWQWIPAGVILLITLIGLVITPRQARSFGYQLRHDDLVFRRGILWQRVVAVPYGRMQLVDITHGPLDRGFGIAQLKLVTAAASTGVTIPGLTQEAAEHLRDTLVAVAETRRTGL